MGRNKTVILSTHILPEVEATCGRAMILVDGKIRADGTLDELTRSRAQVVTLAPDDRAVAERVLAGVTGVSEVRHVGQLGEFHTFRLELQGTAEIGEGVATAVQNRGWPLRELRRDDKTLEQVFRELTAAGREVAA